MFASGLIVSCSKENVTPENGINQESNIDWVFVKSQGAAEGRTLGALECETPAEACAPEDVIVYPCEAYDALVKAVGNGTEHDFFRTENAVKLFPWLYSEKWQKMLAAAQNKSNKLIVIKNPKTGVLYYNCVVDKLNPKYFKVGMEFLTIPIIEK